MMKLFNSAILLFGLVFLLTTCFQDRNRITSISIGKAQGVGPNAFLVILKIHDKRLASSLEKCEVDFVFSPPLSELSSSSTRCFRVSEHEYHIRINSTLWGDLSLDQINSKELKLNQEEIVLRILNTNRESWLISNT